MERLGYALFEFKYLPILYTWICVDPCYNILNDIVILKNKQEDARKFFPAWAKANLSRNLDSWKKKSHQFRTFQLLKNNQLCQLGLLLSYNNLQAGIFGKYRYPSDP